ncbi:MAG: hypothetical protein IJV96_00745, partial [Clostridia bacterium]|nr:hypothetical protein [Clostridia bacterium]
RGLELLFKQFSMSFVSKALFGFQWAFIKEERFAGTSLLLYQEPQALVWNPTAGRYVIRRKAA